MANNRLNRILNILSPDGTAVDFTEFDANVAKLKAALKEKIQAKTLDDVNNRLEAFQKRIDFKPLTDSLSAIETSVNEKIKSVNELVTKQTATVNTAIQTGAGNATVLTASLTELRGDLENLKAQASEISTLRQRIDALPDAKRLISDALSSVNAAMDIEDKQDDIERERMVTEYTDLIESLRKELTNRINNFPHGGNANRNIAVGGNTSVLSRFTDINLKAGANVTLSYTNNNTSKYLDLTIAATGGGGGTTRSINSISTSQTAAAVAGTDYVYICSAGIQLTLPDAIGNTNLYTVKNTSTSSVLVSTTAAETIDGQSTAILPVQYTAIDLISDGANWDIT